MTWAFVAVFVGLAVVSGALIRRDIRKAVRRRQHRQRMREFAAGIDAVIRTGRVTADAMRELTLVGRGAAEAVAALGESLAVRTGRRGPFKPHAHQKGKPNG